MLAAALAMLAPLAAAQPSSASGEAQGTGGYDLGQRPRSPAYVVRVPLPARREIGLPPIAGPDDPRRPLVVIDPGHGGFDLGAKGAQGETEKKLALALATALRDELVRRARVRVALTRQDDRFLALEERSGIARRLGADLFISIHADAATDPTATGATVYTLAERGSDEAAAAIAARENKADRVGGVALGNDQVSLILTDLSKRRMLERSAVLARLIVREGRGRLRFRPEPRKDADFVVLRSLEIPSVLVEAGYITNPADAAQLASPAGSAGFVVATARAIEAYFARLPPER